MSFWTGLRNAIESAASLVGNYFLPGSSIVTSQLVSKGSQEQLNSPLGQLAQIGTGVAGGVSGNLSNYGSLANAATTVAGSVGDWASSLYSSASPWTTSSTGLSTLAGEAAGGAAGVVNAAPAASGLSSWLGPLMSVGSGLYGMSMAEKLRQQAMLAGKVASPWTSGETVPGSGQALAQKQLMDVMSNGSNAYMNTPAFQARMQAAMRTAAAAGGSGGGAEIVAAANAAGGGYNDYIAQMAQLAGAPGSPVGAAQVGLQGAEAANTLAGSSLASIGYGVTRATGGGTAVPPAVRQWLVSQGLVA